MGWEVSFDRFLCCGGIERRGHPLRGGWSHSPPVGKGGNVDDSVLCVGGEYGGDFVLFGRIMARWFAVYSLVENFGRDVARDIG